MLSHERREHFLSKPIERFSPEVNLSISQFLQQLEKTGGQPRHLAEAFSLWKEILVQKRTIYCAISGAPVPFGFGSVIAKLIEERFIDVLALPGSQIGHDIVETLGGSHYQGNPAASDAELVGLEINRYWDTFGDERDFKLPDPIYKELIATLPQRPVTTREFVYRLGLALIPHAKREGILTTAARKNFPIYCVGVADSVVGTDAAEVRFKYGDKVIFDVVKDNLEATSIAALTEDLGGRTSAIIFGGGLPRNWIQQAQACSYMIGREKQAKGHAEAIRFSYDPAELGNLSGSTISEGVSWRKYAPNVKAAEGFCDANLSLVILATALLEEKPVRPWELDFINEEDGSLTVKDPSDQYNLQSRFGFS